MARTPREFTEELLRFADQEKLNLVITREGMTPLFEIDGVSYEAFRLSGRFGIVVQCQMTEPRKQETDLAQQGEEEKQKKDSAGKKAARLLHYSWPVLIWLFYSFPELDSAGGAY